jgi:hypothetical protein
MLFSVRGIVHSIAQTIFYWLMTCMEGASGNVMMSGHFAVSQPHNLYIGTAIQNQNKMNLGAIYRPAR